MDDLVKTISRMISKLEEETRFLSFHRIEDQVIAKRILEYHEEAIIPLFKYLQLVGGWWAMTLIHRLLEAEFPEIPDEIKGRYDMVRKFYINYGIEKGYISERSATGVKVDKTQGQQVPGEVVSSTGV